MTPNEKTLIDEVDQLDAQNRVRTLHEMAHTKLVEAQAEAARSTTRVNIAIAKALVVVAMAVAAIAAKVVFS